MPLPFFDLSAALILLSLILFSDLKLLLITVCVLQNPFCTYNTLFYILPAHSLSLRCCRRRHGWSSA